MKLYKAFEYRTRDALKAIRVYYFVLVLILVFGTVMLNVFNANDGTIGGFDMAGMTFIFIFGLNSFKEYFYQFLQHGISRKTGFYSFLMTASFVALLMSLVEIILCAVMKQLFHYYPAFTQIYGPLFTNQNSILFYVTQYIWTVSVYLVAAAIGYLITVLYYRMNKTLKIAVSVGVPVFFLTIIPTVDYVFLNGRISKWFSRVKQVLFGVGEELHPYHAVLTCIAGAVLCVLIAYQLVKKVAVKRA